MIEDQLFSGLPNDTRRPAITGPGKGSDRGGVPFSLAQESDQDPDAANELTLTDGPVGMTSEARIVPVPTVGKDGPGKKLSSENMHSETEVVGSTLAASGVGKAANRPDTPPHFGKFAEPAGADRKGQTALRGSTTKPMPEAQLEGAKFRRTDVDSGAGNLSAPDRPRAEGATETLQPLRKLEVSESATTDRQSGMVRAGAGTPYLAPRYSRQSEITTPDSAGSEPHPQATPLNAEFPQKNASQSIPAPEDLLAIRQPERRDMSISSPRDILADKSHTETGTMDGADSMDVRSPLQADRFELRAKGTDITARLSQSEDSVRITAAKPVQIQSAATTQVLHIETDGLPDMTIGPHAAATGEPDLITLRTQAPQASSAAILRQITVQTPISMLASAGTIQISLTPEDLGALRLTVTQFDSGPHVVLSAERADTLEIIRRNSDVLAEAFADMGYDNPSFSFDERAPSDAPDPDEDQAVSGVDPVTLPALQLLTVTLGSGLDLRL